MDPRDRKILRELQDGFPLRPRPFLSLARRFGMTEEGLLKKLNVLQARGLIRYLGIVFDLEKLGLSSTLVAMRVPPRSLKKAVKVINGCPQVTHNYLREGPYNVWFTLSAASDQELFKLIRRIKTRSGIADILDLRKIEIFKKRAVFA